MKKKKLILTFVLVIAMLFTTSCTQSTSTQEATAEQTVTEQPATEQTQVPSNVIGQVITTNTIENTNGNYSIPIPDSWFNKTSYEIDGTNTYIYHITQDQNELEINPVLLHIDASDDADMDEMGIEIFLEINNTKYYEVLRFDAPYNQGTPDDNEYAALANDIPMILQSVWVISSATTENTNNIATGTVITTNKVVNEEGGYEIPIPDSWFNKTSYELMGTATYIYHITQDTNEFEINPTLLHIDVEKDLSPDTSGVNVFLQIKNTSYYEVVRFDFPYNADSADGNEFSSLSEEIPMILQSTWVLDDTDWTAEMNAMLGPEFNQYDASFDSFYAGLSAKDDVLNGIDEEPKSIEAVTLEATGQVFEDYQFSFGTLSFSEGLLVSAIIRSTDIYGPRGIRVGDNVDEIMTEFSLDAEMATDSFDIIYRANAGSDINIHVPPACIKWNYEDGNGALVLTSFDENMDLFDMTMEQLEAEYMYIPQYSGIFYFDESGTINMFIVSYSVPSE